MGFRGTEWEWDTDISVEVSEFKGDLEWGKNRLRTCKCDVNHNKPLFQKCLHAPAIILGHVNEALSSKKAACFRCLSKIDLGCT